MDTTFIHLFADRLKTAQEVLQASKKGWLEIKLHQGTMIKEPRLKMKELLGDKRKLLCFESWTSAR